MTLRRAYAIAAAPWFLVGIIGPWQFLVGGLLAAALIIGVAAWLAGGEQ